MQKTGREFAPGRSSACTPCFYPPARLGEAVLPSVPIVPLPPCQSVPPLHAGRSYPRLEWGAVWQGLGLIRLSLLLGVTERLLRIQSIVVRVT